MTPRPPMLTAEQAQALTRAVRKFADDYLRTVGPALAALAEQMRATGEQMHRCGLVPPPEPDDPAARALERARNRNTGPRAVSRPPRRIDPRRSR